LNLSSDGSRNAATAGDRAYWDLRGILARGCGDGVAGDLGGRLAYWILTRFELADMFVGEGSLAGDIEARIVFQSGIPVTMIALDVTRKTSLTDEHVRQLEAGSESSKPGGRQDRPHAINHNREQGFLVGPNMHDPLPLPRSSTRRC